MQYNLKDAALNNLPKYPALVNSILGADLSRITYIKKHSNYKLPDFITSFINSLPNKKITLIPEGCLLICKVFMQKQFQDNAYPYFDPEIPTS